MDYSDTPSSEQSRREAAIVDRHLPDGYSAAPEAFNIINDGEGENPTDDQPEETSLALQGGDIHRDIFKIKARATLPRRANTFSGKQLPHFRNSDDVSISEQLEPGGFRREFVQRQGGMERSISAVTLPAKNFISFLELYGNFAGEDLADDDTSDADSAMPDGDEEAGEANERRPLLGRRKSAKRPKPQGDASTLKTFFTLLKAFVGTGIMFLPKAFKNGGMLFSSITLISVSFITSVCFSLLLQARKKTGSTGYGDIGAAVLGPKFRSLILSSITLSQLGFVCAGIIFTADNLVAFADAIAARNGQTNPLNNTWLIAIQVVLLIPLALIRNISKLGPAALLADVFILIGVVYIWQYDIRSIATRGMPPSVVLFNSRDFTLTIGSAIFTFEGIGLILPIQSSMKKPEHFSYLLYLVMFIITIVFTSVGALCYATFGDETKIQIITNFPQNSKLVNAVQFLYSLAVLVGEPVQLFPAVRILEVAIFGDRASGKKSKAVKWQKNGLRSAMMVLCLAIAIVGAADLDKFVALIGSFACVPLVYIYPPYIHLKGVATTIPQKVLDISLMTLGVVAMGYTTAVTITQWARDN